MDFLHMLNIKPLLFFCGMFILACCINSCRIAEPPSLPQVSEPPTSFPLRTDTDTTSIADIHWSEFFNDTVLTRLIDTALQGNLDLMTAIQRVEMARTDYHIRQGALFPTLQGRVSVNAGLNPSQMPGQAVPDQTSRNFNQDYFLGFQSTWEADIWGRLRSLREASFERFLASEKGVRFIQTLLVSETARLYYEILALDNELEIVNRNIRLQETALEVVKIQKMSGRATELAVQQVHAQLLNTTSLRAQINQQIIEAENQLNLLLGRYPKSITKGPALPRQAMPEIVNTGLPSELLLRRPDIQEAEHILKATKADIEAARAAFLPSVIISPYAGLSGANPGMIFNTPESIVAGALGSILAPIFNRRQIRANYERRIAEARESVFNYQNTILTAYQEVSNNLWRLNNYREIYSIKEQEVEVLQNAVSVSNDLFTAGYASYLEVITSQGSVLEAELELVNIKKELFFSLIELYRALGGGWQEQ